MSSRLTHMSELIISPLRVDPDLWVFDIEKGTRLGALVVAGENLLICTES